MPYRLLEDTLIDVLIRRPHRLNLFLSLPVAMLVVWGTVYSMELIARRMTRHGQRVAALIAVGIGLIILWENPIRPFPTTSTEIPQWYQELAKDPHQFGILELPTYERGFDKLYMFYQTLHGKPITGGHVSRMPGDADAFRESVPFLQPMLRQDSWLVQPEDWVDFAEVDVTRQFRELAEANIRYIVINKTLLPAGIVERWRDWVTIEPAFEDDALLVYQTLPEPGSDFVISHLLADGIGLLRAAYDPQEANQVGVVKIDVRWASESAPKKDYDVCFSLRDAAGFQKRIDCQELALGFPTTSWEANEIVRGSYLLPVDADLEAGDYSLEMFLAADGAKPEGETAVLGNIHIYPFQPKNEATVCWDEKVCLKGYDLAQSQGVLDLVSYWQAPQELDGSFKLFVHLVDLADGAVVAQSDSLPRNWTYPTNIWEAGEIIRDPVSLSLDGVAPGEYAVFIGWYDVENGQRLEACPTGDCNQKTTENFQLTIVNLLGE